MWKKQLQKDQRYLASTKWSTLYGDKPGTSNAGGRSSSSNTNTDEFHRLPFDHCALSLQSFENPYCDVHGNIFDFATLLKFIGKYRRNPVTGEKIDITKLIKLNFAKNNAGEYHCPVMFKVFTPNSYIVAIKPTGNVFSYEAIEQFNIKTKNWRELLTDTPFVPGQIITLQDPRNLKKFNLLEFHHIKMRLKEEDKESVIAQYEQLNKDYVEPEKVEVEVEKAEEEDDSRRYERIKDKGYVRLETNCGVINFQLHCESVPKACENFIKHCASGYYNGTIFHRSTKHSMIQGGDPTGKGTGGESIWGKPFDDEFKSHLKHEGSGILAMANSGPNTNKSQFYITYRSCGHLDRKHTVFGRVIGGLNTLSEMEKIEVDKNDRPVVPIVIEKVIIISDPFGIDEILTQERSAAAEKELEEQKEKARLKRKAALKYKAFIDAKVAKYIAPKATTKPYTEAELRYKRGEVPRRVSFENGFFDDDDDDDD